MQIKIPISSRKKALLLIDIQPGTLSDKVLPLINTMQSYIQITEYDAYALVSYYADKESMLFKQNNFSITKDKAGSIAPELVQMVVSKSKPFIEIEKNVRSCFKGFEQNALANFLGKNLIEEVHLIGYDINDCVLASAYDAIDQNYFTYVIEELCHHWNGIEELKEAAITILRRQSLTNNSCRDGTELVQISEIS
jgi:nicotinamidase-related amidase